MLATHIRTSLRVSTRSQIALTPTFDAGNKKQGVCRKWNDCVAVVLSGTVSAKERSTDVRTYGMMQNFIPAALMWREAAI
jgi:hypothetical protein